MPPFDLSSHYAAIDPNETVEFSCKQEAGKRGLFQKFQSATRRFRFVATNEGVVYDTVNLKCCFFNNVRNVFKMNFEFNEAKCSLLFLKHNMYLVGFGSGEGNNPYYEFGNLPFTFNFTRVPGLSFCYPKTPSNFHVNGNTLFEAVKKVGKFQYEHGMNIQLIRKHLEVLMWFVSESARIKRIFQSVSDTLYNYQDAMTKEVVRDPKDIAVTKSWKDLSQMSVDNDDTQLNPAKKEAIGVQTLQEVVSSVLAVLAFFGKLPPGWDM